MLEMIRKPINVLIFFQKLRLNFLNIDEPGFLRLLHQRGIAPRTVGNTVSNRFFLEKCAFFLHPFAERFYGIEIQHSCIVWNLRRILPCFVDSCCDMDTFRLCKLKIHITKFWCFMRDAGSVCIGDKISIIDTEIFLRIDLSDVIRKRR